MHLEEPSVSETWDYLWDNKITKGYSQHNFTSNKILVYGHAYDLPAGPWILFRILTPNGHALMEDDEKMRALASEYVDERNDYFHACDKNAWIIVKR